MKVLIVFKTSAVALLSSTLLFMVYCWLKDGLIETGERSNSLIETGERSNSLSPGHQWHLTSAAMAEEGSPTSRITKEKASLGN